MQVGTVTAQSSFEPTGRIRGVNKAHWDQRSDGMRAAGFNAIRFALDFAQPPKGNLALVQGACGTDITPIIGNWQATCAEDPKRLSAVVDTWVAQASTWTHLAGIINIANEAGAPYLYQQQAKPWAKIPQHGWRDSYIDAVRRMRHAGYIGKLMIDAGQCGQDWRTIVFDGPTVLAADPVQNLMFDLHIYGGLNTDSKLDEAFDALKGCGLEIVIGEFGPGNNIGPSPTPIDPLNIINRCEDAGFGWLAWAWDDGPYPVVPQTGTFALCAGRSVYTGNDAAELTEFGRIVVPLVKRLNGRP